MSSELLVYRDRTTVVPLSLGMNVSGDTITSEIRVGVSPTSTLLGTWDVTFVTDGSDGEVRLEITSLTEAANGVNYGYMDLKRLSSGKSLSVFRVPLRVKFQGVVTA